MLMETVVQLRNDCTE